MIQRVNKAAVTVNNDRREISAGLVILVAIKSGDTDKDAQWLAEKIVNLRIFYNEKEKFDRSVFDIKGELLVVSQFTLYGDCRKGRRPDFTGSAAPDIAKPLYEKFVEYLKPYGLKIVTGEFAASMLVEIHNDGPVTVIINSQLSPQSIVGSSEDRLSS